MALHVCADKHDVLKVNFTLAALEADDPFVKEVLVSVLHFECVELLCSQGCNFKRSDCRTGMASNEICGGCNCSQRNCYVRN